MGPLWLTADTCIVSDKNYKFLSTSTSNLFDTNVLSPRPLTTSMNSSQFTSSSPSASDNTRSASYNANDNSFRSSGVAAPAHAFAGTRTSNYHDQSAGSMCAPKLPDRSGFLGATILRANKSSVLPKTNVLPSVVDFVAARTQKHKETKATPKVAVPKRSVWSSTCGNPCAPGQNRGKKQPPKNEVTKQNPSHRMHGWYSVQQARHNFVKQKKKDMEEELAAMERGEMLKKDNKHPPATHVYAWRYSNKPAGCNVIEAKKRTEEEIQMAQRKKVTINGELKKRALMTQANKTPMSTMKTDRPDPQDTHSLMSPVKLPARSAVPEKRTVVNKTLHDVAARTAQTHSDTAHARSVHPGICPKLPAHSPGGKVHVKAVSQGVCPKFSVQPRRNPEHFYARSPTAPQPTSHGAPGNLHASNDDDLNMTETGVWASMDLPRSTPRVLTLCDVAARRAQTHSDAAHAWSVPAINKLAKVDDDLAMTETGVWANLDLPRSTPRTLTLRDVAARRAQTHSDAAHAWSVPAINKLAKVLKYSSWQLREKIRRRVLTEIHGLQAPKAVSYDKNTTLRDVPARSVQTHSTAHMRSVPPGLCPKLRVHPPGDKVYVKPVPQRIRPELSAQSHGNPIRENVYARSPPFPQPVSYGSLGNLHASNDKNLDMTEMGVWANVDLPRPTQRTVERPLIVPALNMDLVDREVSHSSRSASEIPPTATDTTGFLPGAMCSQTRG